MSPTLTPCDSSAKEPMNGTSSGPTDEEINSQGVAMDGSRLLTALTSQQHMLDPVSAVLDPSTLQSVACTRDFKWFIGPLFCVGSVTRLIVNQREFSIWLQEEVNKRMNNMEPSKFKLRLAPPKMRKQPQFEFHADAYITNAQADVSASDMGMELGVDDKVHDCLCVLALRNIELHRVTSLRKAHKRCDRKASKGTEPCHQRIAL